MPPLSPSINNYRDHAYALRAAATTTDAGSASGTESGVSASDLILEAEEHWNVSATSILIAWGATLVGSIAILTLFSFLRMKYKLIYLPRIKVRKQGKTIEEHKIEQEDLSKMTKDEKKRYKELKEKEKPECYPPEDPPPGTWISKAPRAETGLFGWLKPTYRETLVELRAALPRWCCLCLVNDKELRDGTGKKGKKGLIKRPGSKTLFEQDKKMLSWLGLDAMIYLLFLRLLKYLFSAIAILASLLALTNYYINTQTSYGSTSAVTPGSDSSANSTTSSTSSTTDDGNGSIFSNPQLLTAANITGNGLIVHISFEWIVTTLVIFFVLKSSSYHLKLVQEWIHMNYNEVSFKTIMITNLSIHHSRTNGTVTVADARRKIRSLVLGSESVDASVWFAIHNMNPLHERMEDFKKKHLNMAVKAVAMETHFGVGQGVFYDSCTGSLFGTSKSAKRRVDEAVEEKRNIEIMQDQIRRGQLDASATKLRGTVTSAFVTVPTARKAREILKAQRVKLKHAGHPIERAPRSHNVLWRNLELDVKSHRLHRWIGRGILGIIYILNIVPVMIVTILANLSLSADNWPTLARLEDSSKIWKMVFTVIAGLAPAGISALFSFLLPHIMRRLTRWSGALTRGDLDKAVIRQLFAFLLISNFVFFSLIGVLYETYLTISEEIWKESWTTIYQSLGDVPAKIAEAYISESSYWLSWYPIHAIVLCLEMLQLARIAQKIIPRLLTIKTPHDLAEARQPENFEYAIEYSHNLFAMAVGMVYAPLAPVVAICAAVFFWCAAIVYTNQLKFVEDSKETDGKCWKIVINRLLVSTVFMQGLMALIVGLKTKSIPFIIAAALPILIIFLFKLYLRRHFHPDGEIFSEYIDAYVESEIGEGQGEDKAPIYEHELLRYDWMPKMKTVRSVMLMRAAKERFGNLEELLRVGRADSYGEDEKDVKRVKKKKKGKSKDRYR